MSLDLLQDLISMAGSVWSWAVAAFFSTVLAAWNKGRNLGSVTLLVFSLFPALLVLNYIHGLLPPLDDFHVVGLTMLCVGVVLLAISSLVGALSLVTRQPLPGDVGFAPLLLLSYAPLIAYFGLGGLWLLLFALGELLTPN